jgi:hypothetical protein
MINVPLSRPFNVETNYEVAIVCSLQDPLCQQRVKISTATMSGVPVDKLPWAKVARHNSQFSSNNGGTMETAHTFKVGDPIIVYRSTSSEQDWTVHGHPGSIASESGAGGAGSTTGPQNFFWNSDVRTANTQSAKPKVKQTTYPADNTATWNNPGQIQTQLSSEPDVRQHFDAKAKQYNYPSLYQTDIWNKAQHIIKSMATGSPVTQVILNEDQTFLAEASKNNNPLQIMHRLRMELNTPDLGGFLTEQTPNGLVKTIQGLMSGGGMPGLQGIIGTVTNLISSIESSAQAVITQQQGQNQAMANNNQQLAGDGTPLPLQTGVSV